MEGATFVLLSGAVTIGVPLALAVRELIELRRRDGSGWDGDGSSPRPPPPPTPSTGYRPLPDCLIPRPSLSPVRGRELEEV